MSILTVLLVAYMLEFKGIERNNFDLINTKSKLSGLPFKFDQISMKF